MKNVGILILAVAMAATSYGQEWKFLNKVTQNDRRAGDNFGFNVGISGRYAIAGAFQQDLDVNGQNPVSNAGAAYIMERTNAGKWYLAQKLVAPDRMASDLFGFHVSISGDFAIVGATYQDYDENAGNPIGDAGAAYVYQRQSNGTWAFMQKLVAPDRSSGARFGWVVNIHQDFIMVSAPHASTDPGGGNPVNKSGACYIFKYNGSTRWDFVQKIVANDRKANDEFGSGSLTIRNGYAFVGVANHSYDVSGSNFLSESGAMYVFKENSSGVWIQESKLVASDRETGARYGGLSFYDGNTLMISAIFETKDENGLNPVSNAGACYFYEQDTMGNWIEIQKVVASDRSADDWFGIRPSVSGKYAFIGANHEDHDALGMNKVLDAGSAYIFERDINGKWNEVKKVVAFDRDVNDLYGRLEMDGNSVIIPARYQDYDSAGNNEVIDAGGVYFYELCSPSFYSFNVTACIAYRSPSGNYVWTESGQYNDTIQTYYGCDSILTIDVTINKVDATVTKNDTQLVANATTGTYQWVNCDNGYEAIPGETNKTFVPTEDGNYALVATQNGCVDTSACILVTGLSTGDLDISGRLVVYPNPSSGHIAVELGSVYSGFSIKVFNATGELVLDNRYVNEKVIELTIEQGNGLYLVRFEGDDGHVATARVVLLH